MRELRRRGGGELTTFDARRFRLGGGGIYGGPALYGFFLLEELTRPQPLRAPEVLADLARRVAAGTLDPVVSRTVDWREADAVARALLKREFPGKAARPHRALKAAVGSRLFSGGRRR